MTTLAMRKPHADRGIEGLAAKWYAANTAEMMREYIDLARRISTQLPQGCSVLEVAPGPGYFCIELAKLGSYAITGLDISHAMVRIAAKKAVEAGMKVGFQQGSASNIPFPAGSFDFILCRAAFKNFARPVEALQEMFRVLKPGGRGLIIDLKRNASPQEVSRAVDAMGLSWFNRVLTKLAFRTMLIRSAYTKEEFQQMLAQASFRSVEIDENDMGLEIWMTK
ncbi:MAG TPA: class I SAM-dependent methyltransferase [Terracidiphilus sp.]|jgi:ubiquinone/menaquinone biosynthesis C-methylase UbiE